MSSEKRREANRANARKSTGPKTQAGKEESRRNALKHGLSGAGVVLRRTDEKKLKKRVEDFKEVLAPINPLEDTLVERAALAAVRCESAVRQEAAERRRRIGQALSRLEARKRKKISEIVGLLETEPADAGRKLRRQKRGIAWLIGQWRRLAERLEGQGFWDAGQFGLAMRLLGKDPALPYPDDLSIFTLRKAFLAALPWIVHEEAEALLGLDGKGLDDDAREAAINARLPEPADARNTLRTIAAEAIGQLKARREHVRETRREKFERSEAIARAEVGTDIAAERLHRYERNQELGLHRNLNELIKVRKQEPELASIARWEKQGKTYNRRWDGYSWVPNAEWRVDEEKSMASGSEAGLTGDEPSPVAGPSLRSAAGTGSDAVPQTASNPQAATSVAGLSAWREPGAPQPQLPPGDPDPSAQKPVTASGGSPCSTPASLADGRVGDWGSGIGAGKTIRDDGCPMPEHAPTSHGVSHPSSVSRQSSGLQNEAIKNAANGCGRANTANGGGCPPTQISRDQSGISPEGGELPRGLAVT